MLIARSVKPAWVSKLANNMLTGRYQRGSGPGCSAAIFFGQALKKSACRDFRLPPKASKRFSAKLVPPTVI